MTRYKVLNMVSSKQQKILIIMLSLLHHLQTSSSLHVKIQF